MRRFHSISRMVWSGEGVRMGQVSQGNRKRSSGGWGWVGVVLLMGGVFACNQIVDRGTTSSQRPSQSIVGQASALSSDSLRRSQSWTTDTRHPAYQFYQVARRGHVSTGLCREYGGTPGNSSWSGNSGQMLTQGVVAGQDASLGRAVGIGYSTRNAMGVLTASVCKFRVR